MKRLILLAAALVLLLGAGLAVFVVAAPRSGLLGASGSGLRDFIGQQIAGIVSSYLEPDLTFETVDFAAPGTVDLTGVRLTAPDGTVLVRAESLSIELAEIPAIGKPLQIAKVAMSNGEVNIAVDPDSGQIRGLTPLLKANGSADQVPEEFALSNVLVLEQLRVDDVDVSFDPGDGTGAIRFEGLKSALDISPATEPGDDAAPAGTGWYNIKATAGRLPGLAIDANGRLNIDSFAIWLDETQASIDLSPTTVESLPAKLRSMIESYDLRGHATVKLSGMLEPRDPLASELRCELAMDSCNIAQGTQRLTVDSLEATLQLEDGRARLDPFRADALDGSIAATASAELTGQMPVRLEWTVTGVELAELNRPGAAESSDVSGRVTTSGSAQTQASDLIGAISGAGTVAVRDGRFISIPMLAQLAQLTDLAGFSDDAGNDHTADAEFEFKPDGVHVIGFTAQTRSLAARGSGVVSYAGDLDMTVNAGPLEKLQGVLGKPGELIGKLTDKLVSYRVEGTVAEPSVSVQPLGIGG